MIKRDSHTPENARLSGVLMIKHVNIAFIITNALVELKKEYTNSASGSNVSKFLLVYSIKAGNIEGRIYKRETFFRNVI